MRLNVRWLLLVAIAAVASGAEAWGAPSETGGKAATPAGEVPDAAAPRQPQASPTTPAQADSVQESLDLNEIVLAAAKAPVSVQESPSIITIITREQMLERGYRTLADVLQTVPGFETGRLNFVAQQDIATRGNFSTVLVLWNGVSIVAPDRTVYLDRNLPLDIVDRIEVTSGPGGVLWGANAFLGIVNIITRRAEDSGMVDALAGWGTGEGDPNAAKASVTLAHRFLSNRVRFVLNGTFYTTEGARVRLPIDVIVPVANEPNPDGVLSYRASTSDIWRPRAWVGTVGGSLGVGPVTLDFFIPWERTYSVHNIDMMRGDDQRTWDPAAGQAVPTPSLCNGTTCYSTSVPPETARTFHLIGLRYQGSFLTGRFQLSGRAYWVGFNNLSIRQAILPIGIFGAPYVVRDMYGRDQDSPFHWFVDQYRRGVAVDATLGLRPTNRAIVGIEAFQEGTDAKFQAHYFGTSALADEAARTPTSGRFPLITYPAWRAVLGVFLHDEWRPLSRIVMAGGVRYQGSWVDVDTTVPLEYDLNGGIITPSPFGNDHQTSSQHVVLGSAAVSYNVFGRTHLKFNFAQGFRPPALGLLTSPQATITAVPGNPNLNVERSQAFEGEVNTVITAPEHGMRKLYLRADFGYTTIDDLITFARGGLPANEGHRQALSVEAAAVYEAMLPLRFWLNYCWLDLVDRDSGPVRNVPHHKLNLGGSFHVWRKRLEFGTVLSLIGAMQDLNRTLYFDDLHPGNVLGTNGSTAADLRLDAIGTTALWRLVVWARNIVPHVDFQLTVDNVLGSRYVVPDSDWQARQHPMPMPMPGLSFFLAARVKI